MHLYHIPQYTIQKGNVYITVLNGALRDMGLEHFGICKLVQVQCIWQCVLKRYIYIYIVSNSFMWRLWRIHTNAFQYNTSLNKANLGDLIAATGLLILVKLDSNRRFISPYDLEIWWITSKNNRAPLLFYFKLCASFRTHWWIQSRVTVRKHPIWIKIRVFLSRVTLKFDGCPWKTIGHLSYAT